LRRGRRAACPSRRRGRVGACASRRAQQSREGGLAFPRQFEGIGEHCGVRDDAEVHAAVHRDHGDVQAGRVRDHRDWIGRRESARAEIARAFDATDVRHGQVDDRSRNCAEAEPVRHEPQAEGEQGVVQRGLVRELAELGFRGARIGHDLAQPGQRTRARPRQRHEQCRGLGRGLQVARRAQ